MGYGNVADDTMQGASAGGSFGPWGAAAGGVLGLGKYFLLDKPKYERQLALTSATQRYSPWTHLQAQAPGEPDPFSNALAFGSQGAALGQNISANNNQATMQDAYLKNLNAQTAYLQNQGGLNYGQTAPRSNGWLGTNPDDMDTMYGRRY